MMAIRDSSVINSIKSCARKRRIKKWRACLASAIDHSNNLECLPQHMDQRMKRRGDDCTVTDTNDDILNTLCDCVRLTSLGTV